MYLSIDRSIDLSIHRSIDLSIYLCIYLSIDLSIYRSIDLSIYQSINLSIYRSIDLSIYRSMDLSIYRIYRSIYLSARSKTKKFCEMSLMFEHNNVQNETILRDVFIFELDNIRNETSLRDFFIFLNLTTSKTKQFGETSVKNGKLSAELTDSYQCVLQFFQSTCLKYCACHGKLMPGHTKCCTCHAKSS